MRPAFFSIALACIAHMASLAYAADVVDTAQPVPPPHPSCHQAASAACWYSLDLPGGAGRMHYYASRGPADGAQPRSVLLVMHGHPRDANRSFDAGIAAARAAGRLSGAPDDTLVIAPLYPVDEQHAGQCHTRGVPAAQTGDAVWTCGSWMAGRASQGEHPIGSFAALDALVADIHRQWPSVQQITLAGFSAGAQMLQRSIPFAASPPQGVELRYVIADPGTWLYFDPIRPQPLATTRTPDIQEKSASSALPASASSYHFSIPNTDSCPRYDDWKYGIHQRPAALRNQADAARERYRAARIHYLEGALDTGTDPATHYRMLDRSCAANLQGPYRLERGLAYAAYDATVLQPLQAHPLTVVPGCAHDVRCVLPSAAARAALFPD